MKSLFQLLSILCAAVACLSAPAAPLKRADVSANPVWVLHVDFDALRQTYLGKYLLYQINKPEMNSNMVAFESIFSFDLRTQLHGLTFYGDNSSPQDCVGIVYADFDPSRVIKLLRVGDGSEITTNNQQVIYSWIDKKKNSDGERPRDYAGIQRGFLILGKNKERVIAALAVANKRAPNLSASHTLPELGAVNDPVFVQAAARQLDFLGADPNVALLKMARRAKLRASEADEQLTAVATLEFDDEARTKEISSLAQGFVALLALQKNNPKAASLAGDLTFKQDRNTLTVTFAAPSADLIAAIKMYDQEKPRVESK